MAPPGTTAKLGREDKIGPGQENEWRLQRIPAGFGANGPTATHGGTSVSIPKQAQHPEEAWQIIEHSHLTEAVLQDSIERGIWPSYIPVLDDPVLNEPYDYYEGQVIGELYKDLALQMPRIFQSPWAPEIPHRHQQLRDYPRPAGLGRHRRSLRRTGTGAGAH